METILIAAKALNDIRLANITFADFSNQLRGKEYQELSQQAKREVRTFVSCALHKQEIAKFTLLQHGLDEMDTINQSIVNVFLCNRYFLKILDVDVDKLLSWIDNEHDRELVSKSEIILGTVKSLFPSQLDFKTPFALSLRYNFPIDFVEKLIEDFGFNKTQRFLDKYSNVYQIHGRINPSLTTIDTFLAANQDFKQVGIKDAFVYDGKTSIKGLDSYKNCQFYTMPVTDLLVADQIIAFNPSTMLIVEQEKTSMLIDLAKQKPDLIIHMLVANKHRYHVIGSVIKMFTLTNVVAATEDRAELLDSYDIVYLTPSSSNLEQIKARPDFFIKFNLDEDYASAIYQQIESAKKYIKAGGRLIVKVGTLLRKETVELAQKFIAENDDYTLEYERQYMPYHKEQTIAYYAIFRKKNTDEN